jgi:D-mannonate dehydratase
VSATGARHRGRQLERFAATVRNMGAAGIPTLGYNWMVNPPASAAARAARRIGSAWGGERGAESG